MLHQLIAGVSGQPKFDRFVITQTDRHGRSKPREVARPNDPMRQINDRLGELLEPLVISHPAAPVMTGSRPGISALGNVRRHLGQRHFYAVDLSNAFPSVDLEVMARVLATALIGEAMVEWLLEESYEVVTKFCSTGLGLAQGAPAVPTLFNLYCAERIDLELARFCDSWDITYSRYVDDLTFSSNRPMGHKLRRQLRDIITSAGFTLADHKTQLVDLERHKGVIITGYRLERGGRIHVHGHSRARAEARIRAVHDGRAEPAVASGHLGHLLGPSRQTGASLNRTDLRALQRTRAALRN